MVKAGEVLKVGNVKMAVLTLNEIRPYWNNPRSITQEAVDKVRASIERYGFNQPLILGNDNVVLAGHTRYVALRELGVGEALCVLTALSSEQAVEYRIVDNKTREMTGWHLELLLGELRGFDLSVASLFFPELNLGELEEGGVLGLEALNGGDGSGGAGAGLEGQEGALALAQPLSRHITLICPECGLEAKYVRADILESNQTEGGGSGQ